MQYDTCCKVIEGLSAAIFQLATFLLQSERRGGQDPAPRHYQLDVVSSLVSDLNLHGTESGLGPVNLSIPLPYAGGANGKCTRCFMSCQPYEAMQ